MIEKKFLSLHEKGLGGQCVKCGFLWLNLFLVSAVKW